MSSLKSFLEAAEQNFKSNNLKEAIDLANKAKELDPNSDCVNNLLTAYNVHLSASKKFRNNIDWYAALGIVNTSVDTGTIKKSYKNLALKVHPDKNNSLAADGAFKLIHEAWNVLSQPSTRNDFDERRASWPPPFRSEESTPTTSSKAKKSSVQVEKPSKAKRRTRKSKSAYERFRRNPPTECPSCHSPCSTFWDVDWTTVLCTMCNWGSSYPNRVDDFEVDEFEEFEYNFRHYY